MEKDASEIAKLTERILKDPKSKLFVPLAEEYKKIGQIEMAVSVLTEGLKNNPGYATARSFLGRLLLEQGNLASAQKELEEVVKAIPDNLLAQKKLGDIFILLGKPGEALQRYKTALTLNTADKELAALVADMEAGKDVSDRIPKPKSLAVPVEVKKPQPVVQKPATPTPMGGAVAAQKPVTPTVAGTAAVAPKLATPERKLPLAAGAVQKPATGEVSTPSAPAEAETAPLAAPLQETPEAIEEIVEIEALELQVAAQKQPKPAPAGTTGTFPPLTKTETELTEAGAFDLSESAPVVQPMTEAQAVVSWEPVEMAMPSVKAQPPAETAGEDINTDTLAELYISQGFYDKAIEIYQRMLAERPDNVVLQKKLLKLHALAGGPPPVAAPMPTPPKAPVQQASIPEQERKEEPLAAETAPLVEEPAATGGEKQKGMGGPADKVAVGSAAIRRKETIDRLESWLKNIVKEKKE